MIAAETDGCYSVW